MMLDLIEDYEPPVEAILGHIFMTLQLHFLFDTSSDKYVMFES